MRRNALICLAGSLVVSNFAFAQENSKIGVDVLASAGYSHYNGFKERVTDKSVTFNGFNINASALYSIMKTEMGSPVVGLGVNYNQMNSNSVDIPGITNAGNLTTSTYKQKFNTLAIMGNFGYKFTPVSKLAIYTLLNLGYGVYNNVKPELTTKDNQTGADYSSLFKPADVKVSNHFIYGVSLIGTYEIVDNFSLGLGATLNRHEVKFEYEKNSSSTGSFNEYSANLIASYSL